MSPIQQQQRDLFCFRNPAEAFEKLQPILSSLLGHPEMGWLAQTFEDTRALFEGSYPGYRACNTLYHDFSHTVSVVSASVRLLDGCLGNGFILSPRNRLLTLISSFFHDVGLIQTESDPNPSGAVYTVGHEERSIEFMKGYLRLRDFSNREISDCANIIRCTILSLSPMQISFSSEEIRTCGHIVGSADLLAQMADRVYLEKLFFLFGEFQEAGLPDMGTELDFLRRSREFYENAVKKRLEKDLGNIRKHLQSHFKNRLGIDADLYAEAMAKNNDYLNTIITHCPNSLDCCQGYLRREGS